MYLVLFLVLTPYPRECSPPAYSPYSDYFEIGTLRARRTHEYVDLNTRNNSTHRTLSTVLREKVPIVVRTLLFVLAILEILPYLGQAML